ncbi:2,5-diamino-6-(ribosylamino)-4(3H)-pyrimidinone 5'-phosphate reductase, partial [Nowakowskiella sp. JEL0078]
METNENAFKFFEAELEHAKQQATTERRPAVTLTYAQSLDGFLALPNGPFELSGPESLVLTHTLRATHDCILVGVSTVIKDNPLLNVRLFSFPNQQLISQQFHHPRPVILDSKLRLPLDARILSRNPIVFTLANSVRSERRFALESKGAEILEIGEDFDFGGLNLESVLNILFSRFDCRSLMVEGGASVIRSFLAKRTFVNQLVVTISPIFLGNGIHIMELNQVEHESISLSD